MAGPDRRIGAMCDKLSRESNSIVPYTRFVDDLTISAKFPHRVWEHPQARGGDPQGLRV